MHSILDLYFLLYNIFFGVFVYLIYKIIFFKNKFIVFKYICFWFSFIYVYILLIDSMFKEFNVFYILFIILGVYISNKYLKKIIIKDIINFYIVFDALLAFILRLCRPIIFKYIKNFVKYILNTRKRLALEKEKLWNLY